MTPLEKAAADFEAAGLEAIAAGDRYAEAERQAEALRRKAGDDVRLAREKCDRARAALLAAAAPRIPPPEALTRAPDSPVARALLEAGFPSVVRELPLPGAGAPATPRPARLVRGGADLAAGEDRGVRVEVEVPPPRVVGDPEFLDRCRHGPEGGGPGCPCTPHPGSPSP